MGEYKNKAYPLRLDNELMEKVRKIAEKEDRPLSKQFERIVRQYIENYEKEQEKLAEKEKMINNTESLTSKIG